VIGGKGKRAIRFSVTSVMVGYQTVYYGVISQFISVSLSLRNNVTTINIAIRRGKINTIENPIDDEQDRENS
jgi:hypothetical protein